MRGLLLALALLLAAPAASAQLVQPVQGAFEDVYVVAGRVVDERGYPVAGAELTVELAQPGIRAAPLKAPTNCKGDFITSFNLKAPTTKGSVTVTVKGRDGVPDAKATERFDPFFRRTDMVIQIAGVSDYRCAPNEDVWPIAVSVTGRIVNRTDPREVDGVTYEAVPYAGQARLRYTDANGTTHCPPAANAPPGACDFLRVDERGDFRYTFTFPEPVDANGTMAVVIGDVAHAGKVDWLTRQAVLHVEATGRGAPVAATETPGPAPVLVALAAVGAALLSRRLARR